MTDGEVKRGRGIAGDGRATEAAGRSGGRYANDGGVHDNDPHTAPGRTKPGGAAKREVRSVTVVGLGAVGGSVAKAVRERLPGVRVNGIDPDPDSVRRAKGDGVRILPRLGAVDPVEGVVVFAVPLDVAVRLIPSARPVWGRAALATDVASLKAPVMDAAGAAWSGAEEAGSGRGGSPFVGAHPMCGTERSGYAAARADLFQGADLWLCGGGAEEEARDRAVRFWSALGARARWTSPGRHDRRMAWASHLPQLLAGALAATLAEAGLERSDLGPGGRDMTRLAASSPEMWLPLIAGAAAEDAMALRALEARLTRLRAAVEGARRRELAEWIEEGRRWVERTD